MQSFLVGKKLFTCDVCGPVCVVLVHESGSCPVEPGHGIHATLVSFADVLFRHDQLYPVPPLRLVQPLVGIDGNLFIEMMEQ